MFLSKSYYNYNRFIYKTDNSNKEITLMLESSINKNNEGCHFISLGCFSQCHYNRFE